ncbi:(2Fe-2S)-binding protein [Brevibacterium sp. BDJS002]|uniref:(2Fe-2S)-binding protein n=1 Tax=Brevibacterium sp. BDJS002 TaxID=3020906 RepID=UPI002308328E|nr:(2Fe-2S)-binding protein [Brevibacterium sp. BDJS002]WCE41205.1 (2Fe-2S)-binding protein [Brevibacterium sp. BDJS002]
MTHTVSLHVNGKHQQSEVDAGTPLIDHLRHGLRLTGAHVGCRSASCGACTVLLDGRTVKSCCVLAVEADGAEVETVENGDDELDDIQRAFVEAQAMQCGFCTPGMIVSVRALLAENPHPSDDEARAAIRGNLCRCTGYTNILKAITMAAENRDESSLSTE